MAWSDIFKTGNNQQQQQQPQQQMPNGGQQPQGTQPNGTQQQQQQNPQGTQGSQNTGTNETKNPLDVYGKMFDTPDGNDDKPPTFSIDSKVMDQVVSSQDFMNGADPELVQLATSGDVKALMQLINHSSRSAYRAAIEHGGVLTDKFVGSYSQHQNKKLPDVLKGHFTEQSLAANTPNFKHPVVKRQLTEIAQRLQKQHPDASPQEIADMSRDYLTELMSAITPEDPNKTKPKDGEVEWEKYFDSDS
jgi:hypothetical protein